MYIDTNTKISEFKKNILKNNTPVASVDENKNNNFAFYVNQCGIYIPQEVSISQYFDIECKNINGMSAIRVVRDILVENSILNVNKDLSTLGLVTYYILHEEGHYVHYINEYLNKKKSVICYLDDYNDQYDSVMKDSSKINFNSPSGYLYFQQLYREIEFEKIADDYAIKKIKENEDLIRMF